MQTDHVCPHQCFQSRIGPSKCCTKKLNSSEKMTYCHLCIQFYHWAHHCYHASLCCIIKGSYNNNRRIDSSRCSRRHRTVRADISAVNINQLPISRSRSCKSDLTTCLPFEALVAGGQLDPYDA
ncbi:hypothetical protein TNCV_582191 [Trichonephila clavipes]|nr:hypothetical protein TNCV_582191 [Trichonephila clavipes]